MPLPNPARYLPFLSGRYEVKPGLSRFGKDFGNGPADRAVFQFDCEFPRYHAAKHAARVERLDKYHLTHELQLPIARRVERFILGRLIEEHPDLFAFDHGTLACRLTGERVLVGDRLGSHVSALDALACQVQEDLAIVSADAKRHWISFLHICFPNHWSPAEKIGRTFAAVHEPVAGMEEMNARQEQIVRQMIQTEAGLVRFAWGITTDDGLNRHPDGSANLPPARRFDPENPVVFVRVERQTIWGFPDVGAALFTIRTHFLDCNEIRSDGPLRTSLFTALKSMTPSSIGYKGLTQIHPALLRWLG